jgi:spore cortex biosynthesis protein YabQ
MHIKSQLLLLLLTTGVGWIGGLFYDIYSFAFRLCRPRGWRLWFWDIGFWLLMLVLTYSYLLKTVWGEFRVSLLFTMVMGFLLYRRTLRINKKILLLRAKIEGLFKKPANTRSIVRNLNSSLGEPHEKPKQ